MRKAFQNGIGVRLFMCAMKKLMNTECETTTTRAS
jgi:hypothetical protein